MSKTFWTCLNCNEEVESQFEVCWNCQRDRTGVVPPSYSDLENEDHPLIAPLNAITRDQFCLACQNNLTYVGSQKLHSGICYGIVWNELAGNQIELEMFFCPACGRVEFFMPGMISEAR
jgi:hypothetical protein